MRGKNTILDSSENYNVCECGTISQDKIWRIRLNNVESFLLHVINQFQVESISALVIAKLHDKNGARVEKKISIESVEDGKRRRKEFSDHFKKFIILQGNERDLNYSLGIVRSTLCDAGNFILHDGFKYLMECLEKNYVNKFQLSQLTKEIRISPTTTIQSVDSITSDRTCYSNISFSSSTTNPDHENSIVSFYRLSSADDEDMHSYITHPIADKTHFISIDACQFPSTSTSMQLHRPLSCKVLPVDTSLSHVHSFDSMDGGYDQQHMISLSSDLNEECILYNMNQTNNKLHNNNNNTNMIYDHHSNDSRASNNNHQNYICEENSNGYHCIKASSLDIENNLNSRTLAEGTYESTGVSMTLGFHNENLLHNSDARISVDDCNREHILLADHDNCVQHGNRQTQNNNTNNNSTSGESTSGDSGSNSSAGGNHQRNDGVSGTHVIRSASVRRASDGGGGDNSSSNSDGDDDRSTKSTLNMFSSNDSSEESDAALNGSCGTELDNLMRESSEGKGKGNRTGSGKAEIIDVPSTNMVLSPTVHCGLLIEYDRGFEWHITAQQLVTCISNFANTSKERTMSDSLIACLTNLHPDTKEITKGTKDTIFRKYYAKESGGLNRNFILEEINSDINSFTSSLSSLVSLRDTVGSLRCAWDDISRILIGDVKISNAMKSLRGKRNQKRNKRRKINNNDSNRNIDIHHNVDSSDVLLREFLSTIRLNLDSYLMSLEGNEENRVDLNISNMSANTDTPANSNTNMITIKKRLLTTKCESSPTCENVVKRSRLECICDISDAVIDTDSEYLVSRPEVSHNESAGTQHMDNMIDDNATSLHIDPPRTISMDEKGTVTGSTVKAENMDMYPMAVDDVMPLSDTNGSNLKLLYPCGIGCSSVEGEEQHKEKHVLYLSCHRSSTASLATSLATYRNVESMVSAEVPKYGSTSELAVGVERDQLSSDVPVDECVTSTDARPMGNTEVSADPGDVSTSLVHDTDTTNEANVQRLEVEGINDRSSNAVVNRLLVHFRMRTRESSVYMDDTSQSLHTNLLHKAVRHLAYVFRYKYYKSSCLNNDVCVCI